MTQFRLSQKAKQDLQEIWDYIGSENPEAADSVISEIVQKFLTLAQFPQMGRDREELASSLRSFPVGNYVVFYYPTDNGIEVARVLYGARDIQQLFWNSNKSRDRA